MLYHQINQEDLEEDQDCPEYEEGDNQRVFRDPNMMELNIHNKKLFWASFLVVEVKFQQILVRDELKTVELWT